jgi:BirA family biotin operon repressor/biotin-[acetyl-CoA-carboxylase] ligase
MTINEHLIRLFEEKPDVFHSGEALCSELGCSRTTVWKHIESLRQAGYVFEAVPRKGYRYISKPDKLDVSRLSSMLQTQTLGRKVCYYDEVDSTQTIAHSLVAQGADEGTLVIAEQQNAGHGRMGRKWHSPKGKGLWMSLILKPSIPLQFMPQLTLLVAVALCRSISHVTELPVGIKWPNDLLIEGKKVSGILLESSAEDEKLKHIVAGVGISVNLTAEDYPGDLQQVASSLLIQKGKPIDREELLCRFLLELENLYKLYHEQGFTPIKLLWEALNVTLGRQVRSPGPNGLVEGTAVAIDDFGALRVRLQDESVVSWYSSNVEFSVR